MSRPHDEAYRDEQEAGRQLRTEGIVWATPQEILNRVAANREARAGEAAKHPLRATEVEAAFRPQAASEKAIAPELNPEHNGNLPLPSERQAHRPVEVGPEDLQRTERPACDLRAIKRSPGRPPKIAPWFESVAKTMADGIPLRQALFWNGITALSDREIRSLYHNVTLRKLYRLERQIHRLERWGKLPATERERMRGRLAARIF